MHRAGAEDEDLPPLDNPVVRYWWWVADGEPELLSEEEACQKSQKRVSFSLR